MEGISTDLGKTFVEKLINGVIGKSRYLFCYKCIANEFELEKEKLEAEWETMTQRFTKAKEKGKDIQSNAQFWEKQANKLIQEDTKLKQRCFFGFCPDCIWLYKRGEELANKTEEIKKLMVKGEKLENVEVTRSLPDVERYSSQSYISFKTRESKYNELLNALKDDSYYTIGLHGMGGTGKTTMAKEVGKQLKTSMQFNRVSFTTVSNTPNIKKIQDDIAGHLDLEWRATNESTRPTQLWDRLTNGEKILVILDDVWDDLNFEDIGIPNSDNHKGCKVLVTTRYLKVCKQMSCAKTIQLDLLSEEEAWEMFKRHAELSNISSKNILDQGSKIALECKGLPIAIALIARSLKGEKRQENWDAALNSLQNPMPMAGVDDTKVDIYKCLKFSYDNLKDKKAKELFLLCSIFQEDEEISTEILTRLGIGIGLFGEDYKKYNHARTLVVVAKDNLLDSCLLLSTNKRDVKMHDLIREVAQWIANKEILAVDFSNKTQKSLVGRDNNIKYLLFEGNPKDLCSSGFDGSKLKILIFIVDNGCFVDSFFKSIAGLLVLNLRAGKQSTISFICSLIPGAGSSSAQYTPGGLLFKMSDSNMQYVTSTSFLLVTYAKYLTKSHTVVQCGGTTVTPKKLRTLAKKQVDYLLGDNPLKMSYMVGYGPRYPQRIHHRGSSLPSMAVHPGKIQCSAGFSVMSSQSPNPNILVGAVVGGPDQHDRFPDERSDYEQSEPATYVNAPLVGTLAYLAHSFGQI